MHALVTGASGFLGGRLVELLTAGGHAVTVLARPTSLMAEAPGVEVLRTDFHAGSDPLLGPALAPITHVFHCAGCSTDWAPAAWYEDANVGAVAAMVRLARVHMPALQRFVHVSTTDVYGYPRIAGDETMMPCDVRLPYNSTKLRGEALVWQAGADGLPITIVRPASIYGPGGKAFVTDIVTLLRQRLMLLVDGGRAPGGFVYVDDVCEAMLLAAEARESVREAYNISSVDALCWREYTERLARLLGLPMPWLQLPMGAAMALAAASEVPHRLGVPGRPLLTRHAVYLLARDQQYSTAKAAAQLGWRPRTCIEAGLQRAVAGL